jgi:hypothetical protein
MAPSINQNGHTQDMTIVASLKQGERQNHILSSALLQDVSSECLLSMLRQRNQEQVALPPPTTATGLHPCPVFPVLSENNEVPMNVADIAREAMRLTKETLRNEEMKQGAWTAKADPLHGRFL